MKSLTYNLIICGVIGILSSFGLSLLLTWTTSLPRIGFVPLSIAAERMNTLSFKIWVFVIVFLLGSIRAVARELRRRTFSALRNEQEGNRKRNIESGGQNGIE
jgi:hypothetical protein